MNTNKMRIDEKKRYAADGVVDLARERATRGPSRLMVIESIHNLLEVDDHRRTRVNKLLREGKCYHHPSGPTHIK